MYYYFFVFSDKFVNMNRKKKAIFEVFHNCEREKLNSP